MPGAAEVPRDDDRVARPRPGPEQDAVLPHPAEGGARDREDVRFLRVPTEDRDPELPHAFLHPVREAPEELDVGIGGHPEGRGETEGARPPRPPVAPIYRGRPTTPPFRPGAPPGVGLSPSCHPPPPQGGFPPP